MTVRGATVPGSHAAVRVNSHRRSHENKHVPNTELWYMAGSKVRVAADDTPTAVPKIVRLAAGQFYKSET